MIFCAAFLFAANAYAQEEHIGGVFFENCGPMDGAAVTIETQNHLRITVYKAALESDGAYRTKEQAFEGEQPTMEVDLCDANMEQCKSIEAVLTTYKAEDGTIEAAIEYFDGTESRGDSESLQGHITHFTVKRDRSREPKALCG